MSLLFSSCSRDLIAVVITITVIIISYLKWHYRHWEKKGLRIPSEPSLLFGNTQDLFFGKEAFGETFRNVYRKFRAEGLKHGGLYFGPSAYYMPVDVDLIKNILQKDFAHFVDHGGYANKQNDPLSANLFNLDGAEWRNLRVKLTPIFTSGKMKMMFNTMVNCTEGLKELLEEQQNPIDIKETLSRFTTDIIGSCGFGIECNSLKDPNAEFRKYGRRIFENTFWENLRIILQFVLPLKFMDLIKYKQTKSDVEKFFMAAVKDTVEYREKNKIYRKDMMHLLLQLKNRGTVADDDKIKADDGKVEQRLTIDEVAAQAFVFFIGGFETSSTTMTFALLELAQNQEVQQKLRDEIVAVLEKHNNNMTYEAVQEMIYMDKVLNETLRKYPPAPMLFRKCTKDYVVPGTDVVIEKGTNLIISSWGLHTDPEYFPNPDKFDPERFNEEEKNKRPAISWIPFGEGPRLCIGLRFGLLQSKVGLVTILKNFKVTLNKKMKIPIEIEKTSFITSVAGGVWLDVTSLK